MIKNQIAFASDQDLEQLCGLFRVLADKNRMRLLLLLAEGELNVTAIGQRLGLHQPIVSHHLGVLRPANLVSQRRQGKQVLYCVSGQRKGDAEGLLQVAVQRLVVRIARKNKTQ
jgi:ArsR family transcriptional regulator, zinc-responsive transcriptional repressor